MAIDTHWTDDHERQFALTTRIENSKRGQLRRDIARLASSFRPWRVSLALIGCLVVVNSVLEAGIILFIASVGATITSGSEQLNQTMIGIRLSMSIELASVLIIAMVTVRAVLDLILISIKARTEARYDASLRSEVMAAYLASDWSTQAEEQAGGLQATFADFIRMARIVLSKTSDLIVSVVSFLIMVVAGLGVGGYATAAVMILMLAIAFLMKPMVTQNRLAAVRQRNATESFSNQVNETVAMSREIRVMGIRDRICSMLMNQIRLLEEANYSGFLASYRLNSLHASVTYGAVGIGLGALTYVNVDDPTPYAAMVMLLYRAMVYGRGIQSTYQNMVGAMPYLEYLDARLEAYHAAKEAPGSSPLPGTGELTLRNVSFSYGGERKALSDVNLDIRSGEAIGIVGPSGSGKSTLVQLILGMRRPTTGTVTVGGTAVADIIPSEWARSVTLVAQDSALFNESVIDNVICYRDNVSREDAVEALRAASVLDELEALPDGLDTVVGEDGRRLSGGQRQRVCIARALAGSPDIIIFDEPTSALDLSSEEAVRCTLESLKGSITQIIIAHRTSTLRVCDKVIVVNDGRIEAYADREKLEEDNEYFARTLELARIS